MTRNFTSEAATIDRAIEADGLYGSFYRTVYTEIPNETTGPSGVIGTIPIQRYPTTIPIPTVGSNVSGFIATNCSILNNGVSVLAIEYLLGTYDYENGFTAGVSMPTKVVKGSNVVTASGLTMVVAETDLSSSGTQTIDIEYTDQNGSTGETASMAYPSLTKTNTAYMLQKVLTNGHKGIRAITDISLSTTGTPTGILKIYGLLPIWCSYTFGGTWDMSFLQTLLIPWEIESGDNLAAYNFFSAQENGAVINVGLTPEPS